MTELVFHKVPTSSDPVFERVRVNGVDLFVSIDGKISAVSINGLSLLCGVSNNSISTLVAELQKEGGTKVASKTLEHLRGKVLLGGDYRMWEHFGTAPKLIVSEAAADIIFYYACESKVANDKARTSLKAFTKIGIDAWIKKAVGFVAPPEKKQLPLEVLKGLHDVVGMYLVNDDIITKHVPGVGLVLSAYKDEPALELEEPFLLREYFEAKGIKDIKVRQKFAHYLSGFYKGTTKLTAKKTTYHKQKKMAATNCYSLEHLPLIEAAWENFALGQ